LCCLGAEQQVTGWYRDKSVLACDRFAESAAAAGECLGHADGRAGNRLRKIIGIDKRRRWGIICCMLLVTSAVPQGGKSTLALKIAAFAARFDQKVLLVDLYLWHPSVHREVKS
jgi:Mrp family chromosome partitioning ATPase